MPTAINCQVDLPAALVVARFQPDTTLLLVNSTIPAGRLLGLAKVLLEEEERKALAEYLTD